MAYHLEGRLLEVCNCKVLCPCWIGEDPDFGTCDTIVAWHFDKGSIDGVDVSGRTIALIAHVPGNILEGNWRAAVYLDNKVSPQQEEAILKDTAAAGNVRAKTGTLRWANSLSGYVRTAAGEDLIFSIMLNRYHNLDSARSARSEIDAIAVMLAGFTGRAGD